ncbi:hypothetical protein B0F87_102113 [Methylobacter tundripaludum]|uniref:Uncharacterized protein n=1 Tax=Methylobacter tundripaludum TaxID=173365 RepID=A0A2S6HHQ5_9GAMM|nr:hypothetical protein B0F87_102113 [Methylobacter tundripaludum]
MRYQHPTENIEFEIPDAWWVAAGAAPHVAFEGAAFITTSDPKWPTVLVPIGGVVAPRRDPGVVGLHEDRMTSLLRAFVDKIPVPPIEVHRVPGQNENRLSVRDGFHRYFGSIAVGFPMLPISVRPYFDMSAL